MHKMSHSLINQLESIFPSFVDLETKYIRQSYLSIKNMAVLSKIIVFDA
jgi:hypothetical protein